MAKASLRVPASASAAERPAHPGEVLRELVFARQGLSVTEGAGRLGIARKNLSQILNGHAAISADMALRIAKLSNTTPELWLILQLQHDLAIARERALTR